MNINVDFPVDAPAKHRQDIAQTLMVFGSLVAAMNGDKDGLVGNHPKPSDPRFCLYISSDIIGGFTATICNLTADEKEAKEEMDERNHVNRAGPDESQCRSGNVITRQQIEAGSIDFSVEIDLECVKPVDFGNPSTIIQAIIDKFDGDKFDVRSRLGYFLTQDGLKQLGFKPSAVTKAPPSPKPK